VRRVRVSSPKAWTQRFGRSVLFRSAVFAYAVATTLAASTAFALELDPALPAYETVSGIAGNLKGVGSDTLNNLMAFWSEGFRSRYPNVAISVEGKGSSTAPPALIESMAQFGPMSREMKPGEIDAFEKKFGYKPSAVRVAVDALAVFVHKDNPIGCLTLRQLDAMFSSTRRGGASKDITKWGEVGLTGMWQDTPISLYGRNAASGTYGYFKAVALFGGDFKNSVKEQPGSSAVVQGEATGTNAIGYSGVGYKTADVRTVPLAADGGKCFDATAEAAYAGDYPLARFIYVYINKKPSQPLDPLVSEFLKYILSKEGQAAVVKEGFFPISQALTDEDMTAVGIR
jgi:phosphate transport system substrate-binding protein